MLKTAKWSFTECLYPLQWYGMEKLPAGDTIEGIMIFSNSALLIANTTRFKVCS